MKKLIPFSAVIALSLTACSKSQPQSPAPTAAAAPAPLSAAPVQTDPQAADPAPTAKAPEVKAPSIVAGSIPVGSAKPVLLENGAEILVQNIGGRLYFEVEATFSPEAFGKLFAQASGKPQAEKLAHVSGAIRKITRKLDGAHAIALTQMPEVGYFTFLLPYSENLMAAVKGLSVEHTVFFSPVTIDRESIRSAKAQTPAAEGLIEKAARGSTTGFSGLERIGAPEFVRMAEEAIGAPVNGSSVNVGITDTGITFNHPTFLSLADKTKNRIVYMRDFTREGRVYFHPEAKFEVTVLEGAADSELVLNAEIIATPKLPNLPLGDVLQTVKDLKIQVSPELKGILTTPGSGAKLGVLLEDSLMGEDDKVDINANGKTDMVSIILIPGQSPAQDILFVDATGTFDFRKSQPIGDFNATRSTVTVFSEKVGFDLRNDKLPAKDGENVVAVRSASIVGYDPGNHGSHVAGIASGSKTVANDDDLTLARGAAPESRILMNRVCSNNTGCNATAAFIDIVVNGKAEVVNMSLGGLSPFNDGFGVQETMINRLTTMKNALFVISAGNSGPGKQTVGSPSTARLSLSVGASASKGLIQRQYQWPGSGATNEASDVDSDFMLFFSSRGPTAAGGFKPNLSAPGTELSAIQLNAATGHRGGLDVYWGTSMAAPAATGAFALLLDGVKKFNEKNLDRPLPTDALTLRQVLIETAKPFDVATLDPATGAKTSGQYTWIDQGTGMIHLPAAWKKLFEIRERTLPAAVTLPDGRPVELDYQVLVNLKAPNGLAYDGSRLFDQTSDGTSKAPAFGMGLYIDAARAETLYQVHIARRLPEELTTGELAGELERQIKTTGDTFVLKTVIHGSDKQWLRAGTLDELDCETSAVADLTVLGRGAEIAPKDDGTFTIVPFNASTLNVCIDRAMMQNELPAGDNGALISAYRKVGNQVAAIPSFVVPVYVTVPHKTLAGSTAYEIERTVKSFGVSRNYVSIPTGTTLVRVTLELPAFKRGVEGCSGVELMALEGDNLTKPFKSRAEARVSNCDANGAPVGDEKRKLVFTRTAPKAGMWDLHVFGQYKYAVSKFKMRVDYVTATSSVSKIAGAPAALNGSLEWRLKEASLAIAPSQEKSALELSGLASLIKASVAQDEQKVVEGALGKLRVYPAGTKSVVLTSGGSPGNDLDMIVLECAATAASVEDASCAIAGQSGGATDVEQVTIVPQAGKAYAVVIHGYEVNDEGNFEAGEKLTMETEKGSVAVTEGAEPGLFRVSFAMSAEQQATSKILTSELFTSGKFDASGALTLRSTEGDLLDAIPIQITR